MGSFFVLGGEGSSRTEAKTSWFLFVREEGKRRGGDGEATIVSLCRGLLV